MKSRGLLLLWALAISMWGAGALLAPDAMCGPKDTKGNQDKTVKRSLRMQEIEIHGDVEKPKTMFVIPRASLQYSRKDQEKDFTNEILGPITKEWVEDTQRWRVDVPPP